MMDYLWGGSAPAWQGRKLRVRIGPSLSSLQTYNVNDDSHPHFIDSPYFTGNVAVRVKNFNGIVPDGVAAPTPSTDYFGTRRRLFSIQVQGRFKHEYPTDDVIFGAEFENKVSPPTGAWLAVKFANYIDPALITDMYSDRPWLYSPMLCSMNTVNVVKAPGPVSGAAPLPITPTNPPLRAGGKEVSVPLEKAGADVEKNLGKWEWGGEVELKEENTLLIPDPSKIVIEDADGSYNGLPFPSDGIAERRKWFNKKDNRLTTTFSPDYVYNLEIFAPFIDFNTFDLTLGINVNLLRYLQDQPIRLICKSHSKNIPFYVIEFLLVGDGPLPPLKPGEGEAPAAPQ
ncbi:hypothetical protein HDU97_000699 [Phlyctochytrium planicorne]|nr:hypothetical protein HDU97_000699 [Phlyctochytrium planicorne]